ncbi:MAG: gliding motility protein [Acidobacteria bacterium]|jgi:small GTP-binding protein|nr:MAG: gliding motility protein [Acidobacteriota bacterium]
MLVDLDRKLIRLKVVYYGPAHSGKTTNLEKISQLEGLSLTKIDTKGEKTLVFDFATRKLRVGDMTISMALYTVPGQDIYKDIRLTVIRGVDGIVFVVDAQRERLEENKEFLKVLKKDLEKIGKELGKVPIVLQYNKMDLPNAIAYGDLEREINMDRYPSLPAIALSGVGVLETLGKLEELLLSKIEGVIG